MSHHGNLQSNYQSSCENKLPYKVQNMCHYNHSNYTYNHTDIQMILFRMLEEYLVHLLTLLHQ